MLLVAASAHAVTINASLTQNGQVSIRPHASGCQNNPGPYITLDGELRLSGVKARVILTNNTRWTHVTSEDVTADVVLVSADDPIRINKQPSRGGVGGNPWIYLEFSDCRGRYLSSAPILLGRCVQGLNGTSLDFVVPTGVTANVTSGGCSNRGGPRISLDGELRLGGLCGKLILTNNAKFTHATDADVVIDVVLIPEGKSLTFAKQPPLGGAGGNPIIYVQFLRGDGSPQGDPIQLGRCVQLGR